MHALSLSMKEETPAVIPPSAALVLNSKEPHGQQKTTSRRTKVLKLHSWASVFKDVGTTVESDTNNSTCSDRTALAALARGAAMA